MVFLFCLFSISFSRKFSELNLYKYIPGIWVQNIQNETKEFEIKQISTKLMKANFNKTSFSFQIGKVPVQVIVLDNTTCKIKINSRVFSLIFNPETSGVYISDIFIPEYGHLSITIFSENSIEVCYVPINTKSIYSYGFYRKGSFTYTLADFLIPTTIGLVISFVFLRFGRKYLN